MHESLFALLMLFIDPIPHAHRHTLDSDEVAKLIFASRLIGARAEPDHRACARSNGRGAAKHTWPHSTRREDTSSASQVIFFCQTAALDELRRRRPPSAGILSVCLVARRLSRTQNAPADGVQILPPPPKRPHKTTTKLSARVYFTIAFYAYPRPPPGQPSPSPALPSRCRRSMGEIPQRTQQEQHWRSLI
jgi:hypothetical protein